MKVLEYKLPSVTTRTAAFKIYPLGDVHIGALNCAEKEFKNLVKMIENDETAFWFGGGDALDAVILQDQKRFDPKSLPSWMLKGNTDKIRDRLGDMVAAQRDRFLEMVEPIKDKCIGLIEGNHEYSIMKYHNRALMNELCEGLDTVNLTDCCFIRFKFERTTGNSSSVSHVRMFAAHGSGGGRTAGSEPNHLARLANDKICELVLRGHSHVQHILPPIARLTIPNCGALIAEPESTIVRAANWGCFLRTYASGPSTYDSRATYPVRPLSTIRVHIQPFREIHGKTRPKVTIEELELN